MKFPPYSADDTLRTLIDEITTSLEDINEFLEESDDADCEFANGAKQAFLTCLEIIQQWKEAKENGLDFDPEFVFRF